MSITKSLKKAAIASAMALSASTAMAADYNWTFQSSDQPGDPAFQFQQAWAEDVKEMSKGRIEINVVGSGSVVEYNQTLDSIGYNIIQGDMTDPSYFTGKDAAFALYGNLIGAWANPSELIDFVYQGGGFDVADKLLNAYGVKLLAVSTVGNESLVSKKEVKNLEDLKGTKLRAPEGLVQDLFRALGAAPVNLPGSEVYTALEKGVIDASDYSIFARNQQNGMNDIAQNPIYPGWHSTPVNQVTMNKGIYDALPQDLKNVLTEAGKQYSTGFLSTHEELDHKAIEVAKSEGVNIITWSAEDVAKVRETAVTLWPTWAEKTPMAKEYYNAVIAYLESK